MTKIIQDPVYGYIRIEKNIFSTFIDNEFFQRLRRIEQTSMRSLYPSARHDRFAHSLGVYNLGKLAFKHLEKNVKNEGEFNFPPEKWEEYKITFEISCLMHDCAHSPFSHTFEDKYQTKSNLNTFSDFFSQFGEEFINDYKNATPAQHEIASAYLLMTQFNDKLPDNFNAELSARMITGAIYRENLNEERLFLNNIISLLNGNIFDVDSLDYIQRDTWASGTSNVNIDYMRLLSALTIKHKKTGEEQLPVLTFKKQALSVINNVIIGRNFLYQWIYSHHKVIYNNYLLTESLDVINSKLDHKLFDHLFSLDTFIKKVNFKEYNFNLISDDDIYYLLKNFFKDGISEVDQLLTRNHDFIPLWKTYLEFKNIVGRILIDNDEDYYISFKTTLKELINNNFGIKDLSHKLVFCKNDIKTKEMVQGKMFIDLGNNKFEDAFSNNSIKGQNNRYFHLYIHKDDISLRDEIIKQIILIPNSL